MKQKGLINHGLQSLLLFTLLLLTPLGLWAQDEYPIQVAGVPVTSANAEAITGDGIQGTVTYNAAQNALTLDGATITGNILVTGGTGLTIKVKGENVIYGGGASAIQANTEPNIINLAFVKEGNGDCSLQLNSTGVTVMSTYFNPTYTNLALVTDVEDVSYEYQFNGLSYYDAQTKQTLPVTSATITSYTAYDITVGGVAVTSLNALNISGANIEAYTAGEPYSVSYDVTTNTLSLDNARIASGGISSTSAAALNVALNNSVVLGGTGVNGISCAGDLSISAVGTGIVFYPVVSTKAGGATLTLRNGSNADAQLTLNYQDSESGFNAVVYDGLYLSADNLRTLKFSASRQRFEESEGAWASTIKFSNAKTYELWLGGTKVTESNKNNILGDWGSATFDPDENLLTLDDMTLTGTGIYTDGIISRLPNLTISVKGDNTITCLDTCSVIRADMEGEQTLTIQKGSDGCSLTLDGSRVIRDFNTFTATGLSWNDNDFTYKYDETLTNFSAGYRLMKADGEEASRNFAIGFKPALYDESVTPYDLWVAGVQVTSANAEHIYGEYIDGTVSFDAAKNVLTLKRTTINLENVYMGIAVASGIADLTINLVGDNTVIPNYNAQFFAMYTGEIGTTAPTLTFNTDYYLDDGIYWLGTLKLNGAAEIGNIASGYEFTLEESPEYVDPENAGNATTGWKVSINTKNADNPYVKIWKLEAFDLWLDGNRVLSSDLGAGLSNGPKYNPVTERLVLSNNMVTDIPVMSSMAELTVEINGACSITPESSSPAIYFHEKGEVTSGSLTFVRGDDAKTATLTLTANGENNSAEPYKAIEGFSADNIHFGENLALTSPATIAEALEATTVTIGGPTYYNLKVGGVYVSQTNATDVLGDGGSVIFTMSGGQEAVPTYTLMLNDATLTQPVIIGLPNLTIDIQGTNSITTEEMCIQKMEDTTPAVTFKSTSDVVGTLTLKSDAGVNNVGEYGEGSFTISDELALVLKKDGYLYSNQYLFTNGSTKEAKFSPYYGVTVGGMQICPDNAADVIGDGIGGGDESGMVSFDKDNSILTLTNASLSGVIRSSLPDLTIELVGNNSIYSVGDRILQAGSPVNMTIQSSADVKGRLSLHKGYSSSEKGNFVDDNVTLTISAPLAVISGSLTSDEASNDYYATIGESYGIIVETADAAHPVTALNCSNVLEEVDAEPSVVYDGHSRLVLNNATLKCIIVGTTNNLPGSGLEIYLEGASTITNNDGYAVESANAAATVKLTFLTGGDAPGMLTYTNGGEASENVFPGFDVSYRDNLAKIPEAANVTTVRTPLQLIVDEVASTAQTTTTSISYSEPAPADEPVTTNALKNLIVRNVLYTLNDLGTAESPDGYDHTKNLLVINSTMTDAQVQQVHEKVMSGECHPSLPSMGGQPSFEDYFKGLTFMVPAGEGVIGINSETAEGFEFHLKIGGQPAIKVKKTNITYFIHYSVTENTFVYLYLVETGTSAPAYAQSNDGRRIGPKSTVSGGLGGLNVTSNSISSAPDAGASYLMMCASDYGTSGNYGIKVNNADVTDLPDGAFAAVMPVSPAPRRAVDANMKTFIDVSSTKITGKSFSRTEGAFKDVPEETIIYLPAGNTAVGKNFVIGGICENLELKATRENPFEAAADFTAAVATFDREFTEGEVGTEKKCYTIFLPYALNIEEVDGELWEYTGYDSANETVKMTQVVATSDNQGWTTPNKVYFFKPSKTGALKPMLSTQVKKFTGAAAEPGNESEAEGMHGVYEYYKWTTKPSNVYCYSASDKDGIVAGEFAKVGVDTYIKPFRAYLRLNASTAPEFISISWGDGTTSIVPLDKEQVHQDADGWYTITGFRLPSKPTEKGIYIHNHKKIVVK